jgi:hypothetical protein
VALRISPETVKVHLFQARQRLLARLQGTRSSSPERREPGGAKGSMDEERDDLPAELRGAVARLVERPIRSRPDHPDAERWALRARRPGARRGGGSRITWCAAATALRPGAGDRRLRLAGRGGAGPPTRRWLRRPLPRLALRKRRKPPPHLDLPVLRPSSAAGASACRTSRRNPRPRCRRLGLLDCRLRRGPTPRSSRLISAERSATLSGGGRGRPSGAAVPVPPSGRKASAYQLRIRDATSDGEHLSLSDCTWTKTSPSLSSSPGLPAGLYRLELREQGQLREGRRWKRSSCA